MTNINLYQAEQASEKNVRPSLFDGGMFAGIIIFVIVLAVYGGMEWYIKSLKQQIQISQAQEARGKEALKNEDVNLIASFQQRMDIMGSFSGNFAKNDPVKLFEEVQKLMMGGAVASEIALQDKTLKITFLADNFEAVARQIMSFKNNAFFRDVEVGSTLRDANGKISADLSLLLNI